MLELKNISSGYKNKPIISEISLRVEKGSFSGIIGPNGAGKTTLFRTISRILKPLSGELLFKEKNIAEYSRAELSKEIATMLPLYDIPFAFSVEEFVMMGRFPHKRKFDPPLKRDFELVHKYLELTDIIHLKDRKLNELSGGERQRAILAQALAQEPALLLLDEPTAFLDIGHQIAILDLVKKLNKEEGLTVITILHDLNLAGEYCDSLLLMHEGKIFRSGTPKKVLTFDNIEQVYKTVVVVRENPISGKPYIIAVSKENLNQLK